MLRWDSTLARERPHGPQWIRKFLIALSRTERVPPDLPTFDQEFETFFRQQLQSRLPTQHDPGRFGVVEDRTSLLFQIAVNLHNGGMALDASYGDLIRARCGVQKLTFRDRLEEIHYYLQEHKWLAVDVIEGRWLYPFVAWPMYWVQGRRLIYERMDYGFRGLTHLPEAFVA